MRASAGLAPGFPVLLRDYFLRYMTAQKGLSPRTVEAYRDAFRLLLAYARVHLGKQPVSMTLDDLDAPFLLRFLDSLEKAGETRSEPGMNGSPH
jgi:integrase/recombinase XerD